MHASKDGIELRCPGANRGACRSGIPPWNVEKKIYLRISLQERSSSESFKENISVNSPQYSHESEKLNAKCVRQASRDQSRNQCSMACEIISCLLAGKPFCRVLSFRILSPTGDLNSGLTMHSASHWFAPRLRHRRPHPCAPALRRG